MKKFWMGIVLFGLAVLLTLQSSSIPEQAPTTPLPRTAFVHLFEWTWEDITQECEFLGAQGYAAVQVSPPNEHAVIPEAGFPWWQRYQPVSYKLASRSGDRAQFTRMVDRCKAAGVDIYADAVINHMAAIDGGVGSAGTRFRRYQYPGLYQLTDFHTCRTPINYLDHDAVTRCELSGLPDLNTRSQHVQRRIVTYLQDLVSVGVAGFRIDAAKHIHTTELGAILDRLTQIVEPDPYVYQEVIDPGYEAVKKSEYYANGDVSEFEYGRLVSQAFLGHNGQTLTHLRTLGEAWGLAPSDKAIVFIDNHDKQRGHGGGGNYLTYKNGVLYTLANIFMLAFPYGYPQVMSSYRFDDSDQGPPSDNQGQTQSVYHNGQNRCFEEWICEHRRQPIAHMVGFRNYTASQFELTDWWSNDRNQIAFGRGDRGFVVINRESQPLTHTFQTQLPGGVYCNVIQSSLAADGAACAESHATITVDAQGQFTATVASMEAIALHGGARVH
ncbi:MAG: ATPase [Leptolyngbyaceae cyanobacterium SL_7_1]|nr:ATPase [Leptolyngbyaceae cyanobacterium SL_7_1]